jgi:hypothetical protein
MKRVAIKRSREGGHGMTPGGKLWSQELERLKSWKFVYVNEKGERTMHDWDTADTYEL